MMTLLIIILVLAAMVSFAGRTLVTQTVGMIVAAITVGGIAAVAGQLLLATLVWATYVGAIVALAVLGASLRGGDAGAHPDDELPDTGGGSGKWLLGLTLAGFWLATRVDPEVTDWSNLVWDPAVLFTTDLVRVEAATALLLAGVLVALLLLGTGEKEDGQ